MNTLGYFVGVLIYCITLRKKSAKDNMKFIICLISIFIVIDVFAIIFIKNVYKYYILLIKKYSIWNFYR